MSTHKPTREEIALTEVGHTDIGRGTAIAMVVGFLLLIVAVPVIDTVAQWRANEPIAALGLLRAPPRLADFPRPVQRGETHGHNPLHAFESSLEQASAARGAVQRQVELALASTFHAGSGKVVRGEGDWLFWRPGVDAVSGRGFLSPDHHAVTPRRHRDPRVAIRSVHDACVAAGARLVVLALPDKATIHAERISRTFAPGDAPRNPDDDAFAAWLDGQGIARVDALPVLLAQAAIGDAFLRQDTHWTPTAMDAVAAAVATRVRELAGDLATVAWREEAADVARVGDLVDALKLPGDQRLFAAQSVRIGRVMGDGGPWASDPAAAVLLLGDSFANIYSAAPMGWGEHAGFAAL